jgi:hypothetical protein
MYRTFSRHVNVRFVEHAGGLQDKERPTQSQARHSQLSRQTEVSHGTCQCCGSGMFIPDPNFNLARISNPGFNSNNKKGGRNCCHSSFCATNFTKMNFILFLNKYRTKFQQIDRIIVPTFYSNNRR